MLNPGPHLPTQSQAQVNSAQAIPGPVMSTNFTLPFSSSVPDPNANNPAIIRSDETALQADDEAEEYASDASRTSNASRGRARLRRPPSIRSAGLPDDGYEDNRTRRETVPKSLPIKSFSAANKEQDFDLWVAQYEHAINRAMNPHSLRRHQMYCISWLCGSLDTDAYAIWERSSYRNGTDWVALKKELIRAFEDPKVRAEWKTNMRAYVWNEAEISLQAYCAKVQRFVDTFDNDIAETPAAKAAQYYVRFINGLPDDYIEAVKMSRKTTIEKAMEVCVLFQGVKENRTKAKTRTESASSVKFEDETPSRVTKNETDIKRLMNRMKEVEETKASSKSPQRSYEKQGSGSFNHSAGNKHYSKYPNSSSQRNPSTAGSSPHPRRNEEGKDKQDPKNEGRMKRFVSHQQRRFRGRNNYNNNNNWKQQPQNTEESGFALQTDVESAPEDLNDTVGRFEEWQQEEERALFAQFCEVFDEENEENC